MLSRELEVSLNLAFKDARAKRHEMMTVEHLLLSLLDNTAAVTVLKACNANLDKLRSELETFISDTTPLIPSDQDDRETQPTLGFQRVLQRVLLMMVLLMVLQRVLLYQTQKIVFLQKVQKSLQEVLVVEAVETVE